MIRQRYRCYPDARVCFRMFCSEVVRYPGQFSTRLIDRDVWLEPANDFQVGCFPLIFEILGEYLRSPEFFIDVEEVKTEIRSHDADHSFRLSIKCEFCADDSGITSETALPQAVT